MEVLRKSLSKSAVVRTAAEASEPINLAERRAQRDARSAASEEEISARSKPSGKRLSEPAQRAGPSAQLSFVSKCICGTFTELWLQNAACD